MNHADVPRSTTRPAHRAVASSAGLLAAVLLFAGLAAGCGESQEAEMISALEEVNRQMMTLTAGAGAPASSELRSRVYTQVISDLQPLASGQDAPHQNAARVLLSQAHAGQAEMKAVEASQLCRQTIDLMSQARAIFDRYVAQHSLADAIVSFDSSSERASIEQKLRETENALTGATAKRSEVDSVIADLRRQIAEHADATRTLRDEESGLRSEALQAEGDARTEVIRRAVEAQRRADASEMKMAGAEALVGRRAPDLDAAMREIDRITRQRDNLALALREAQERDRVVAEQADTNRKLAERTGADFESVARDIDQRLRGPVAEAHDSALRSLQSALTTARSAATGATGDERTNVQLAIGRIQQSLVEIQRERAYVWETFSALLQQSVGVDPAMSARSGLSELHQGAEQQLRDALAAGAQALADARASFEQAGGRGEVAERLERVVEQLGALSNAADAGVEPAELAPVPDPNPSEAPEGDEGF